MKLTILGPPGSGKGTYSIRLSKLLDIPHISTGALLRGEASKGTELGKKANFYMHSKEHNCICPDDITLEVLKKRLKEPDCKKGFILDGYPRRLSQARTLDTFEKLDLAIYLDLAEDILIEKALARRTCEKCGDLYNVADIKRNGISLPPMLSKVPGVCDKCGGKLVKRADDTEDKIRSRFISMAVHPEILEFYKSRGILKKVKVTAAPEIMTPRILKLIKNSVRA